MNYLYMYSVDFFFNSVSANTNPVLNHKKASTFVNIT